MESQSISRCFFKRANKTKYRRSKRDKSSQVCPKLEQQHIEKYGMVLISMLEKAQTIIRLMELVDEKNRSRFRQQILTPLIESQLVEPTIKDKPNSPKQTYQLTERGRELIKIEK